MGRVVQESNIGDKDTGTLSGGRVDPSGRRRTDGSPFRPPGRAAPARGPAFDTAVNPGGYLWWYIDAVSDDGDYALTIISFIGSVFSPYYAWAGRRDPQNHCSINVALYGKRGARWTMTERTSDAIACAPDMFTVGPSSIGWDGDTLVVSLDEIGCPLPKRVRGTVRISPTALPAQAFTLDPNSRHTWQPIAPHARIDVELSVPDLKWSGTAYVDSNFGDESLEDGFVDWTWSRAHRNDGCTVLYETAFRRGGFGLFGLQTDATGTCTLIEPPPASALPKTLWGVARTAHSDAGASARVKATLEDTPFYTRSLVTARIHGEDVEAVHESLDLNRFSAGWVRMLLPFRMPRRFL